MKLPHSLLPITLLLLALAPYGHTVQAQAIPGLPRYGEPMLTAGDLHQCLLYGGIVDCWGNYRNVKTRTIIPPLKNPTQIASGGDHSCALHDDGVVCWGNNERGQLNVPPLKNPTQITAGYEHTCAIHDDGIKCWGANEKWQLDVRNSSQRPRLISAGLFRTCAFFDKSGDYRSYTACWGEDFSNLYTQAFKDPTQLSVGGQNYCAIDGGELKCVHFESPLDSNSVPVSYDSRIPTHTRFLEVDAGYDNTCALHEGGIFCWGKKYYCYTNLNGTKNCDGVAGYKTPPLRNPTHLAVGGYGICAIHDDGLQCWGEHIEDFASYSMPFPERLRASRVFTSVRIQNLITSLNRLSEDLPRGRAQFISMLWEKLTRLESESAPYPSHESIQRRLLVLHVLEPFVLSLSSPSMESGLKPTFKKGLEIADRTYGIRSLQDISKEPATVRMALEALKAATQGLLILAVTDEDATALKAILSITGRAISNSRGDLNHESVHALLEALTQNEAALERMKSSPSTQGMALSFQKTTNFLKGTGG